MLYISSAGYCVPQFFGIFFDIVKHYTKVIEYIQVFFCSCIFSYVVQKTAEICFF